MLKIVTLVSAILGILTAISLESWLRRHTGNKDVASEVYTATLEKFGEFWRAQIVSQIVTLAVIGVIVAYYLGLNSLFAYAGGALTMLLTGIIGSRSFVSGSTSSTSLAYDSELKSALKSSFRSGAVLGLIAVALTLIALCLMLFFMNFDKVLDIAAPFTLGASVCAIGIRLSGSTLTSAHQLADTKEYNVDYIGSFTAAGVDFSETLILAAISAALLSMVGVETAGGAATFTIDAAAKYPVIVIAIGLIASIIGIFSYRALTGKYGHFGYTAGCFLSGLIVFAGAIYFSNYILNDRAYAYCVGFGLLAQLLSGEFCKYYSMDSDIFRRNLPSTKDEYIDIPMLHGLSSGMLSAIVTGALTIVAVILSYSVGRYYGVSLAAVGACSVTASSLAIRAYSAVISSCYTFAEFLDDNLENNRAYYAILRRASAKSKAAGRAYSAVSCALAMIAALIAFIINSENLSLDLSNAVILAGLIMGPLVILMFMGLLIRIVISATRSMLDESGDDPDEYRSIDSIRGISVLKIFAILIPVIIGISFGIECAEAFLMSSTVSGVALIFAFDNTGRYYDRIASEALGSVIKLMIVVSIVCISAFTSFGGFNF